jgi:serine protease inhibitor
LLEQTFGAPLEPMDFIKDPARCAESINGWVESQTQGRITNLIPANALSKDTRLVLANAIYLKAPWAREFEESATQPGPFHLSGGEDVDVATMNRQDTFGYATHEGFVAISLPYSDGDLQFVILLPDTATGLPRLESDLTPDLLKEVANLKRQELVLYCPNSRSKRLCSLCEKCWRFWGWKARLIPRKEARISTASRQEDRTIIFTSRKSFTRRSSKSTKRAPRPLPPRRS